MATEQQIEQGLIDKLQDLKYKYRPDIRDRAGLEKDFREKFEVPMVQIELKTLAISPRRAMQQIVEYKNDPGNGNSKTLLSERNFQASRAKKVISSWLLNRLRQVQHDGDCARKIGIGASSDPDESVVRCASRCP